MKSIINRDFLALILSVAVVGLGTGATLPLTALALTEAGHRPDVVGLLTAAQAGGGLALTPFVTRLARRFGARRSIMLSVLALSVATVSMQFTSSLIVWAILRIASGAALALLFTISETWVNRLADDATRGRVVAVYTTHYTLFQMAGPVLVSRIVDWHGMRFIVCGMLFLLALPALASIRRAPLGDAAHHEAHDRWLSVIPRMPALIVGTAFFALFDTLALSLLPIFALDHGVASESAVLLASILLFGDTALQIPIGWLADKLGRGRVHLGAGCVVLALLPVLPFAVGNAWLSWPLLLVLGAAAGAIYTLSLVACGERFRGTALVTASSLMAASWGSAAFGGPLLTGALMETFGTDTFVTVLLAGAMLFVAAAWWERRFATSRLSRARPREQA